MSNGLTTPDGEPTPLARELGEVQKWLDTLDAEALGEIFAEYVREANFNNWDGIDDERDLRTINQFLQDFKTFFLLGCGDK